MFVKRKYGKDQVEVSGTPLQVDNYIKKWLEEVKSEQTNTMLEVCNTIRQMAENMHWEDAKSAPVLTLIKRFAQMRDLEETKNAS